MTHLSRAHWALWTILLVCSTRVDMAHAGAWPQPVDHIQIILPVSTTHATKTYDAQGKLIRRNRYTKDELSPYLEYGLTQHITLVGQLSLLREQTSWLGETIADRSLSEIKFGARLALGKWQDTYFSLQPQIIWHGAKNQSDPFASRRGDIDGEFAITLGRHFKLLGLDGFSDNLIGIDIRPASRPSAMIVNLTIGLNLDARTKVMLKSESYSTFTKSSASSQTRSNKLGLSLVRRLDKTVSIEVGAMRSLNGQNTIQEQSMRVALWYDF